MHTVGALNPLTHAGGNAGQLGFGEARARSECLALPAMLLAVAVPFAEARVAALQLARTEHNAAVRIPLRRDSVRQCFAFTLLLSLSHLPLQSYRLCQFSLLSL